MQSPDKRVRRRTMTALVSIAVAGGHLGAGLLTTSCGATTGQRITLETRVVAEAGVTAPFENAYGWSVTLTKARVSIGPLYYFNGPPVVASAPPLGPPVQRRANNHLRARKNNHLRDLLALFALPEAHAHPGHYTEGDALGQMLTPDTVDLLTPFDMAPADAVTGRYESARFTFQSPPEGPLAGEMDGHVVWLEGLAEKAGSTLPFRAVAGEPDILNADGAPFVEGCVFEVADIDSPGTVTLSIHPEVWLDQVDFAEVPTPPEGTRTDLTPGETPHKAFTRGLKKGTAYDFHFDPTTGEGPQ
ncbi:MAG: hypothetical protein R3B70_49325 [Polyangiaceae bacterium]